MLHSRRGKWRAIDWIAGSTLVAEALLSTIWAIAWAFGCRFEHQLQVYLALVLFILTGGYLALIFCPIFRKDNDPRWFHARILSVGQEYLVDEFEGSQLLHGRYHSYDESRRAQ